MRKTQVIALSFAVLAGCVEQDDSMEAPDSFDPESTVAAVDSAVWAFHAADTARDAAAIVDLLWPEFYMLADGGRSEYNEVVTGTREFLESVDLFATEWTDLRITPLDENHAVASFVFRDSIVTKKGEVIGAKGPTTLVWERRAGEWRILYADADHYPIDEP